MSKIEQACQQELDIFDTFHHVLHGASSLAHESQTANYVATEAFKNTFESLMMNMMKADSGDELLANYNNAKTLLEAEKNSVPAHITRDIHKALMTPIEQMKQQRESYLPEPFNKQRLWKKNAWIVAGAAAISTALALSVVGAPLIPAAILGGVALAYGVADQKNELSENLESSSTSKISSMHRHKLDAHKQQLDSNDVEPGNKMAFKDYLEPSSDKKTAVDTKPDGFLKKSANSFNKATKLHNLFSKKASTKERLKAAGTALSIAGLALAVVAMVAVFPPVGIPLVVGIGIGIASAAVITGAAGVAIAEQQVSKKEHKALIAEHQNSHLNLSEGLTNAFSLSAEKTQSAIIAAEHKAVIHTQSEFDASINQAKSTSPRSIAEIKDEIEAFEHESSHTIDEISNLFNKINHTPPLITTQDESDHLPMDADKEEENDNETKGIRLN